MTSIKREISKEIYDRAVNNNFRLTKEDNSKVFSISELCGYGVYSDRVLPEPDEEGKYYISFYLGGSCD